MSNYYKNEIVEIPKDKIRITSNNYVYYLIESVYSKIGKRCNEKREVIGKRCSEGKMIPNKNYYLYFEKNKHLNEPPKIDNYLHFGQYVALKKSFEYVGALNSLIETFGEELSKKIFAISMHMLSNETIVGQDYDGWAFSNYSGLSISLSSGNITDIYKQITIEKIEEFLNRYQTKYRESFKNNTLDCFAFDSTNQNTSSKNILEAEYGKAKDDDNLKIINTSFMTDEITGIPLYYEHFLGSLLDKTQIDKSHTKLNDLGYQNLFFIFDRGYYSHESMNKVLNKNDAAILVPKTVASTKNIIDKYMNVIRNSETHFLPRQSIYGIKTTSNSFLDRKLYVYIYYDDDTAKLERDSMHGKLQALEDRISTIKKLTNDVIKIYDSYFYLSQGSNGIVFKRKVDVIQKFLDRAGFFVVVSNKNLDLDQMIKIVKNKDSVEKNFRRMKSTLDASKTYCHSGITFEGKMFCVFLAIIMSQSLYFFCKKYFDELSSRTLRTCLNELNKYIIYKSEKLNKWFPKYGLTKQSKKVFSCLNINKTYLENLISVLKL